MSLPFLWRISGHPPNDSTRSSLPFVFNSIRCCLFTKVLLPPEHSPIVDGHFRFVFFAFYLISGQKRGSRASLPSLRKTTLTTTTTTGQVFFLWASPQIMDCFREYFSRVPIQPRCAYTVCAWLCRDVGTRAHLLNGPDYHCRTVGPPPFKPTITNRSITLAVIVTSNSCAVSEALWNCRQPVVCGYLHRLLARVLLFRFCDRYWCLVS